MARSTAIFQRRTETICPCGFHSLCGTDWSSGWQIKHYKQDSVVCHKLMSRKGYLSWHASLGKSDRLVFLPSGFTDGRHGHFSFLVDGGEVWRLIVGRSGRIRSVISESH